MTMMGSVAYMIRQKLYDREITDSNTQLAWEGLLRGGALGIFTDGIAISQKATGNFFGAGDAIGLEGFSRYYARDIWGDIGGPSMGAVDDIYHVFTNATSAASPGGEWTERNSAQAARLLPFNNLFYLRAVLENL